MKIIVALLVFTLIIVVHEFGHFIVAKKCGVFVQEFSVGMGTRIVTLGRFAEEAGAKRRFHVKWFGKQSYFEENPGWMQHTRYSWKILPLGGSCAMLGEERSCELEGSFQKKNVFARMAIVAAGPIFNFILAFFCALFIISQVGYDPAMILGVVDGQPLSEAGVEEGDLITSINGSTIHLAREVSTYMMFHPMDGSTMELGIEHEGVQRVITVVPEKTSQGAFLLGFSYSPRYREPAGFVNTLKYSCYEVKYWISTTIQSLFMMVKGQVSKDDISGPVGVVSAIGDTYEQAKSEGAFLVLLNMLNISILLSANLGVMNLLPIPALDGGRLLLLIVEAVRRKQIPIEKEAMIHFAGFMLLIGLMIFFMYNDITKLITG